MKKRSIIYSLPLILLLIVVVAGCFATVYLGNKARQEIIGESQASVLTLSIYVSSTSKGPLNPWPVLPGSLPHWCLKGIRISNMPTAF
ncbi:MAG: hypothetical protein WCW53_12430 [Syntrophales bacterium]|jgi:hypothetical protein